MFVVGGKAGSAQRMAKTILSAPNGHAMVGDNDAVERRTDMRREPGQVRFDLSRVHRMSDRHFCSGRWQSWSEARVPISTLSR